MTAVHPRRLAIAAAGAGAAILAGSTLAAAAPGDPLPEGQQITALTQRVVGEDYEDLWGEDAVTELFDLDSVTAGSVALGAAITGWDSGGWVIGGGVDVDDDGQGYAVLQSAPVDPPYDLPITQSVPEERQGLETQAAATDGPGLDEAPADEPGEDPYHGPAAVSIDATDGTFGTPVGIVYDPALTDERRAAPDGCLGADYTGGLLRAICMSDQYQSTLTEIGVIDPATGVFTPETRIDDHLGFAYIWPQDLSTGPDGTTYLLFDGREDGEELSAPRLAPVDLESDEVTAVTHVDVIPVGDDAAFFVPEAIDFDAAGQLWALGYTLVDLQSKVQLAAGSIDAATGAAQVVDAVSGPAERSHDSFLGLTVWGAEDPEPDPTETTDPDPTETSDPDPTETADPTPTGTPDPDPSESGEPAPTESSATPPVTTPEEELARTGSDTAPLTALALTALVGGGVIIAALRRRTHAG